MALAVRDITNTSLQTLVTSLDLLNGEPPSPTLDRMRRAINRIRQLDAVLSAYGENVRWRGGDEGFDPVAVIENAREGDGDDRK